MALSEELEGDCCEEELNEAQVKMYSDAIKEYEKILLEARQIKKDSISIVKNGNVWLVNTKHQVRIQNFAPQQLPPSSSHSYSTTTSQPLSVIVESKLTTSSSQPSSTSSANPSGAISTTNQVPVTKPGIQPLPALSTVLDAAFPASQLLSKFTATTIMKQRTAQADQASLHQQTLQHNQNIQASQNIQSIQQNNSVPLIHDMLKKPNGSQAIVAPQHNKLQDTTVPSASHIGKTQSVPTPSTINAGKKTNSSGSDDPKLLVKTIPSLCVYVRPLSLVPEVVNQKKRESLDAFVKSRLVLDSRRFAEWLMQVGLLRSVQLGVCRYHSPMKPLPLQLRMYAEETRFPNSGGYVWISKCCERSFTSIFRESIFEDSNQPPTVLIKLIYHWACQTAVANVVQWVKVDHPFIRTFYGVLRSICTVDVQTNTPIFGAKNGRVEVGVISLGTTSTDGMRRDVRVEVLGIFDQETKRIRLRASEPVAGDSRSRARFAKILQPLCKWVNPSATIVTDFTVERQTLEELGFSNVVQKNLNAGKDDKVSNRHIMDYLRNVVPKVFQNTLSLLSAATIQQFLDELVWREINGQSSADAFHNIIRDIGSQVRAEVGMPIIKRLPLVALDPFKDWKIPQAKASQPPPPETPPTTTVIPAVPTSSGAVKRPAPALKEPVSKEPRTTSFYATMLDTTGRLLTSNPRDAEIRCQHSNCKKLLKTNLDIMMHLREHLVKDVVAKEEWGDHCRYCLETLPSTALKTAHEEANHMFLATFKIQRIREDSAVVRDVICIICHQKFQHYRQLEQHLEAEHVYCEMPYRCRVCPFQTSAHSQLVDHFYQNHGTSTFLFCPLCLEIFNVKDDISKGQKAGHLQYLKHMKDHLAQPAAERPQCKRCILTFQTYDQLLYHIRTDHLSNANNPAVRPFTFSLVKPSAAKLGPPSPAATTVSLRNSRSSTPSPLVSPTPLASPPPSIASVGPAVESKPMVKTYGKLCDIDSDKQSVEINIEELQNTNVARRLSDVTLTEETVKPTDLCIECKEPLKKKNHFSAYLCCSLCQFATCCGAAMRQHQHRAHRMKHSPVLGSVYELSVEVKCKCGFLSKSGLELERHLAECGQKFVTVSK